MKAVEKPLDWLPGLKQNWKTDIVSGFIIFLIALPLCLGIALASGVPPMAGIIAGIVGGLILSLTSGSYVTINGPAAGLAIIVLMSIEGFRNLAPAGLDESQINMFAYQCTLAVGVGCGIVQLIFALLKAGMLSNFFPPSVVHGMMAAIGIMIFVKQIGTAVGVKPPGKEIMELIREIPNTIMNMNYEIAFIALVSLLILIVLPMFKNKYLRKLPAPLIVVLVAIPMGHFFDLEHEHKYMFLNKVEAVGPKALVTLPGNILEGIVFPNFSMFFSSFSIQMIITYALVSSLESLLTASAIDRIDPYKRISNYNRELFAKGSGNILSSFLGGLPIIAEVVRSSANIINGAKTRWSNFFHGLFLLIFVTFFPSLIHQIPLSALAAILIFIGFRLASPKEFIHIYKLGKEQFLIFCTTIIVTLMTDLLIGIGTGIIAKLFVQYLNGVPFKAFFKSFYKIDQDAAGNYTIKIEHSAVFSNYMGLKKKLESLDNGKKIIIDFSDALFVDHSVMSHLSDFRERYVALGGEIEFVGFEEHYAFSPHPHATLKKIKHRYSKANSHSTQH
jgi:MFS superfamily sulfate permease-like transporter